MNKQTRLKTLPSFNFTVVLKIQRLINLYFGPDSNKCEEDPEFCMNGATCERVMNTARCHCGDRYQGDRCDSCSERFEGAGCQGCADGYYGDDYDNITSSSTQ